MQSAKLEFSDVNSEFRMQNSEFRNCVAIVDKLEFIGEAQNAMSF